MSLGLLSQTTDTICLPVVQAKKILAAAEQKKVLEERVTILTQRIEGMEKALDYMERKDSVTVATYEKEIKLMKEQQQILLNTVASLNGEIRREKRRRFWTGMVGSLSTAAAIALPLIIK